MMESLPDHVDTEHKKKSVCEKSVTFAKWCEEVGIKHSKIAYPAFFEGGLIGCQVNSSIEYREAFLSVPFKVVISVDKCLADPFLSQFYKQNPQLFSVKHRAWEQMILTAFIVYQKSLPDSYWAPWLQQMPDVTFFCDWPIESILLTQDPYMISQAIDLREINHQEAAELTLALQVILPTVTYNQVKSTYAQVCTRCFGYYMPSTSLVPMADNFNHIDRRAGYELINLSLHKDDSNYYIRPGQLSKSPIQLHKPFTEDDVRSKFMNDYPEFGITGHKYFVEENNKMLAQRPSKQVWEMKYLHRRLHEDNDTSDDEPNQSLKSFEDLWSRMCNNDLDEKILDKIKAIGPIRYYIKQLQQAQTGAITEEHLDMIEYKEHPRQGAWQHKEVDDETYFCYVNLQRRTLQPGEQAYYCYGKLNNKHLLVNYGFCFRNNSNDSYSFKINLRTSEVYFGSDQSIWLQEFRIQGWLLNQELLQFCKSNQPGLKGELACLTKYVETLNKIQLGCPIEDDMQLIETASWEDKMCLTYRMEKKVIMRNQIELCQWFLKVIKQLIDKKHTAEMFRVMVVEGQDGEEPDSLFWRKRLHNGWYLRRLAEISKFK